MVKDYSFNKFAYFKVLPLVYDDALSYMETLGQFAEKLNEVINQINEVTTTAVEEANKYTDEQIAEKMAGIDTKIAELNTLIAKVQSDNAQFINTVNAKLALYDIKFNQFDDKITADIKAVNNRTDLAIMQNNEYILSELPKFLAQIKVVNYFTGQSISVQDMFDYLAHFHLENAITFNQLVEKAKTYTEYVNYHMTYTQLAMNGGQIIV